MDTKQKHTGWWIFASIVMMAVGFLVMPKIIKIVSAKLYKYNSGEIVIYDDKPEIIRRNTECGKEQ